MDYLAFFKSELQKPPSNFCPFSSIIVPCRNIDQGFEENLRMLFNQDYPSYEILFVVDSEKDPAVEVIKKVIAENKHVSSALLVAEKTNNESQKIHNLRYALGFISSKSKVLVFADSDARTNRNWLKSLIEPLHDKTVGATTGYRWMISKGYLNASELCSVWNASVAAALGKNFDSNFCWGGSTALRREVFESCKIAERWKGEISDDFVITNVIKNHHLKIYFVPKAMTATIEDFSFRQMLEFTTRQIKIARAYAPNLWISCLLGSFLFNLVFLWSFWIIFSGEFYSSLMAISCVVLVSFFNTIKALIRVKAVSLVLNDVKYLSHSILWIISPSIYLYNCLSALFSRKIVWRGIPYDLGKIKTSKSKRK